ncbi:hypothetical protein C1H71_08475 [Iodobacter fluviatilis]|uniref:Uncharacterized protein n=1 Tax=Iodobacter fluviatilis TaxID=537 RepID=A0A7G3G8C5_9NEIS|nr:hypothetical protein C1H71_08475 [Iodobacter fluviatilis]
MHLPSFSFLVHKTITLAKLSIEDKVGNLKKLSTSELSEYSIKPIENKNTFKNKPNIVMPKAIFTSRLSMDDFISIKFFFTISVMMFSFIDLIILVNHWKFTAKKKGQLYKLAFFIQFFIICST